MVIDVLDMIRSDVAERELQGARNRAQFPAAAKLLGEVRVYFPNARIVWAEENGREIGRRA